MADGFFGDGTGRDGGAVPFDVAGALDLARQLEQLAGTWEQAFERRRVAAEQAARAWTGPLAGPFQARLDEETARSRQLVERLRREAGDWRRAADAAPVTAPDAAPTHGASGFRP